MHILKLTNIGNEVGAIFPKDLLAQLNLGTGDEFCVINDSEGLRLAPYSHEFIEQMRLGSEIMNERRAALRELAR
jgi:putative addiction module antidote